MKYVNKISAIIVLLAAALVIVLFPGEYQGFVGVGLFAIIFLIGAVLIYKYKCVNLIAGVENRDNPDVDKQAKYGGYLMFIIAAMLMIAAIVFLVNRTIFESAYMIVLAIPIIIGIPYCIYKMNQ